MGTNFYIKGKRGNDDPRYHVGKRSAAGPYCWDCGITLCKGGSSQVHYGSEFYDACPKCGKKLEKETLDDSSVGRELGFNTEKPKRKTGVKGCSSFTWVRELKGIKHIVDEYGVNYTLEEFKKVLDECPIKFYKYGTWFR